MQIVPNFWEVQGTLKSGMGRNMHIYKCRDGGLVIHSCVALNEESMKELETLGEPRFLIAPNPWHRLDCVVYKEKYPNMKVVAPAACQEKIEEVIKVDLTCEEAFDGTDSGTSSHGIVAFKIDGLKRMSEFAYEIDVAMSPSDSDSEASGQFSGFKGKKGLMFCDFVNNVDQRDVGVFSKLLGFGSNGVNPGLPWIMRWFMVGDKPALKAWIENRLTDVEVVSVGHGNACIHDVRDKFNDILQIL